MKPQWDNLDKAIIAYAEMLQQFVDNVTDKTTLKNLKHLSKAFNTVLEQTESFGKLVEPIAPIDIKYSFDTAAFRREWSFYKEYLMEEFQIHFGSRREQIMLNQLKKWAKKEDKAIAILNFFMANGYVKFFNPSDKQLSGEELPISDTTNPAPISLKQDKKARI